MAIKNIRQIAPGTAFSATIDRHLTGLFYLPPPRYYDRSHGRHSRFSYNGDFVICLDVLDTAEYRPGPIEFGTLVLISSDSPIENYDGPVDVKLSLRGYAPKRPVTQAPSHVQLQPEKTRRTDRGPRAIRFSEE